MRLQVSVCRLRFAIFENGGALEKYKQIFANHIRRCLYKKRISQSAVSIKDSKNPIDKLK